MSIARRSFISMLQTLPGVELEALRPDFRDPNKHCLDCIREGNVSFEILGAPKIWVNNIGWSRGSDDPILRNFATSKLQLSAHGCKTCLLKFHEYLQKWETEAATSTAPEYRKREALLRFREADSYTSELAAKVCGILPSLNHSARFVGTNTVLEMELEVELYFDTALIDVQFYNWIRHAS